MYFTESFWRSAFLLFSAFYHPTLCLKSYLCLRLVFCLCVWDGESLAKPKGLKLCQKCKKSEGIGLFREWESKNGLCECQTSSLMDSFGRDPASSGRLSGPTGGFIGWQALCWLSLYSSGCRPKPLLNSEDEKVCSLVLWNMLNSGTWPVKCSFYVVHPFYPYFLTTFKNGMRDQDLQIYQIVKFQYASLPIDDLHDMQAQILNSSVWI